MVGGFQVDTSWWTGITDTQMIRQDSLVNVHMGIVLEDVSRIAPNVRFVIFVPVIMEISGKTIILPGVIFFLPGNVWLLLLIQ